MQFTYILFLLSSTVATVVRNLTDTSVKSHRQVGNEFLKHPNINNEASINSNEEYLSNNEDKPITGSAFGGSLYLCSFMSADGDSCKYITHPEHYYSFLDNEFVKITGQLKPSANANNRPILSTINIEFYDEQRRTSAVYSRSLNNLFPTSCQSDFPVHYRFLDDNSKEIRLIECSSSNSAYLLNDRRQIYIAILPTTQGLWLSVNMCKDLVDKSRGILPEGISSSLVEDILAYDSNIIPEFEIEQCYTRSTNGESGVKLPAFAMGKDDFSSQLRKICIDSLRRGLKDMEFTKQFEQIEQRTSVFNQHFSNQLPLHLTRLEASHPQNLNVKPYKLNSLNSIGYSTFPSVSGQCTCVESLSPANYLRADTVYQTDPNAPIRNISSTLVYPHSMMIIDWKNGTSELQMKGIIHPAQANFTKPITIEALDEQPLTDDFQNKKYPNFIVKYDSNGARLTRLKRDVIDDDLIGEAIKSAKDIKLSEINLLDWAHSDGQRILCALANKLKPGRLIVSLQPRRYLQCEEKDKATIADCGSGECVNSYNLVISF